MRGEGEGFAGSYLFFMIASVKKFVNHFRTVHSKHAYNTTLMRDRNMFYRHLCLGFTFDFKAFLFAVTIFLATALRQ